MEKIRLTVKCSAPVESAMHCKDQQSNPRYTDFKDTASHLSRHVSRHERRARAVMHVRIAYPLWRGERSRHSQGMHNLQFYVSDKRPIPVFMVIKSPERVHWRWFVYRALLSMELSNPIHGVKCVCIRMPSQNEPIYFQLKHYIVNWIRCIFICVVIGT